MQYDVLVVGAGVVGCATAMELGKYSLRAAVIEAGEDVCTGTSKANSAIVHAGFDAAPLAHGTVQRGGKPRDAEALRAAANSVPPLRGARAVP